MECGIFALLGVIVGMMAKSDKKLSLNLKKKKAVDISEEQGVMQQWENLLSYDGKIK